MSVVEATVEHLRNALNEEQFSSLKKIVMRIGTLSCVQDDALRFAFSIFAESGRLPKVEVEIERVEAKARCRSCNTEFSPSEPLFLICPGCGSAETELLRGDELHIVSVDVGD